LRTVKVFHGGIDDVEAWTEGGGAMLFDRQKDPHELKNLASEAAHGEVVAEMKALLEDMPK
jgi:hypothetical protein